MHLWSVVERSRVQWVHVGEPEVQRQRGKWVVRQAGNDAATGNRRVRQLGTFPSRRAALAHEHAVLDGRIGTDTETVGEFLEQGPLDGAGGSRAARSPRRNR